MSSSSASTAHSPEPTGPKFKIPLLTEKNWFVWSTKIENVLDLWGVAHTIRTSPTTTSTTTSSIFSPPPKPTLASSTPSADAISSTTPPTAPSKTARVSTSLIEILPSEPPAPTITERDRKLACSILIQHLSEHFLQLIKPVITDPYKIWQVLRRHFEPTSFVAGIRLHLQFYALKLKPGQTVDAFAAEIDNMQMLINSISDARTQQLTDYNKICIFLNGLSEQYNMYKVCMQLLDNESSHITWASLVQTATNYQHNYLPTPSGPPPLSASQSVFATAAVVTSKPNSTASSSSKPICKNWQRHGTCKNGNRCNFVHISPNAASSAFCSSSRVPFCRYCKVRGHVIQKCPKRPKQSQTSPPRSSPARPASATVVTATPAPPPASSNLDPDWASANTVSIFSLEALEQRLTYRPVVFADISKFAPNVTGNFHWIIDTGASHTFCCNASIMFDTRPCSPIIIKAAHGATITATTIGSVNILSQVKDKYFLVTLFDVILAPSLSYNILSGSSLADNGYGLFLYNNIIKLIHFKNSTNFTCFLLAKPYPFNNKLYFINQVVTSTSAISSVNVTQAFDSKLLLWHERLGHLNFPTVRTCLRQALNLRFSSADPFCRICHLAKLSNSSSSVRPLIYTAKQVGQVIHLDLMGPINIPDQVSFHYIFNLVDEFTRYATTYLLHSKDQAFIHFTQYVHTFRSLHSTPIVSIHSDRGGEFTSISFTSFCDTNGITRTYSTPYRPSQNGLVERFNRTLMAITRSVLFHSRLPTIYWPLAVLYSTQLKNRTPHSSLPQNLTPYEVWFHKPFPFDRFRVFGCLAITRQPDSKRSKLEPKALEGIFVGYEPGSYHYHIRLFHDLSKPVYSSDVIFNEAILPFALNPSNPADYHLALPTSSSSLSSPSLSSLSSSSIPLATSTPISSNSESPVVPDSIVDSSMVPTRTYLDSIDNIFIPSIYSNHIPTHPPINPFSISSFPDSSLLIHNPSSTSTSSITTTVTSPSSTLPSASTSRTHFTHPTSISESEQAHKASMVALQHQADIRASTAARRGLRRSARIHQPSSASLESMAHTITASSSPSPYPGPNFVSSVVPLDSVLALSDHPSSISLSVPPSFESLCATSCTIESFCASTDASAPIPCNTPDPLTVQEALSGRHANYWRAAMAEELASLTSTGTWSPTQRIPGVRTIRSRWIFKIKRHLDGTIDKFKARLVAKGFTQKPGIDVNETFASIVRHKSWRILVALAANSDFVLYHWDVKTAFLNANLSESVFIEPPDGFSAPPNTVYKLHKGLYGLRQASRQWQDELFSTLRSLQFFPCPYDPSVYFYFGSASSLLIAIAVWVDDLLVYAPPDLDLLSKLKLQLQKKYTITDKGPLSEFLGIRFTRNSVQHTIKIDQKSYLLSILQRFNMLYANPVPTPAIPENKLSLADAPSDDGQRSLMASIPYQAAVGSLLYLAVCTRPDIAAAVSNVARFMQNPGPRHWEAIKRIFRYLVGTLEFGIVFTGNHSTTPSVYAESDATWASTDPDSYKSVTGFVTFLNGSPISWRSIKQKVTALSSTEAEYIAASTCARDIIWVRSFFISMRLPLLAPTIIYSDNRGCIDLSINAINHEHNKHILLKFHFVKEAADKNFIVLVYKSTQELVADLLTKPVRPPRFDSLRYHLVRVD